MLLLFGSWLSLVILALQPPRETSVVAAIFPPWWTAAAAVTAAAAAGTDIIRQGSLPSVLILHLPDRDSLVRLRHAGAWFTADPVALGGCLGRTKP
jgi:hypothetical protein